MVKRLATLVLAAAALLLGSCAAVGPDYHVPAKAVVNAPAAQGGFVAAGPAFSSEAPPDHWWRLFEDPRLDGLVEDALAANTDLRVAEANLERADALLAEARTARQVGGTANADTSYAQRSAEQVLSHVQPPEREIYDAGIGISYDLDLFGGIRRGIEAVRAEDEAVVAARDLVRVNVAADVTRAYADLCNAGHEAQIVGQLIEVQQASLRLTRELIAHGRAPSYEQDRQQGSLAELRSRLPRVEARQRNAAFRLATLSGRPPEDYDRSLLACHAPLTLRRPLPVGDGQALLRRRPDIRAAERRLASATARIGVATAALYPDIRLGASVGSTGAAADLLSPLTNRFAIGPMVSWNLHRSTVRARIEGAEARSRAALASFDGTVLTALRETETALETYNADLERLNALQTALTEARGVTERTAELRRGGRIGGLALLDADRGRVAAEQAAAVAQADVNADQVAVFLSLGGGWVN